MVAVAPETSSSRFLPIRATWHRVLVATLRSGDRLVVGRLRVVRRSASLRMLVALAIIAAGLPALLAPRAEAAGNPDIDLALVTDDRVLYGEDADITLTATNPTANQGHNLSLRLVLPPGVAYVAGSASLDEPEMLANAPTANQTTLIWHNVADLGPGSSASLDLKIAHDTEPLLSAHRPGSAYLLGADAYINSAPSLVPAFSTAGVPSGGFTGTDSQTVLTPVVATILTITDDAGEDAAVLRGVHDHPVVHTFTVQNNSVNATNQVDLDAWLSGGWEFLSCGTEDFTSSAGTNLGSPEEFPGSGPISHPSPVDCAVPQVVETLLTDPDGGGPLQVGVWTHVRFDDAFDLAAGATGAKSFLAAIPLKQNSLTWTGARPPTSAGVGDTPRQTANLDNNNGVETSDGGVVQLRGRAQGQYQGTLASGVNPVTASSVTTHSSEDVRIRTETSSSALGAGTTTTWNHTIAMSEYRWGVRESDTGAPAPITISETVPDGLCPLGVAVPNLRCGAGETSRFGYDGAAPAPLAHASAVESADGSVALTWDLPTDLAPSTVSTLTTQTLTRTYLQEGFSDDTPLLSGDVVANAVSASVRDFARCVDGAEVPPCTLSASIDHAETNGIADLHTASTELTADAATLSHGLAENALPSVAELICNSATYVTETQQARGGDRVCRRIRVDFGYGTATGDVQVQAFIPPGAVIDPGSVITTGANRVTTVVTTEDPTRITWDLEDTNLEGVSYVLPGRVFEAQFSMVLDEQPQVRNGSDVLDHIAKVVSTDSAGTKSTLRLIRRHERVEPYLIIDTGILSVDGTPVVGGPLDGVSVRQGQLASIAVTLHNDGLASALEIEARSIIDSLLACDDVSNISDGGTCVDGTVFWDGSNGSLVIPNLASGETRQLTFDVLIPDGTGASAAAAAGESIAVNSGVRRYFSQTNVYEDGAPGQLPYIPAVNIDPTLTASANTDGADDDTSIELPLATLDFFRTTSVTEAGNTGLDDVTNGETVSTSMAITLPWGTALNGGDVTSAIPAELAYAVGSARISGAGLVGSVAPDCASPLANGFRFCDTGSTINLEIGDRQNVSGVDEEWEIAFDATLRSTIDAGIDIAQSATLGWVGVLGSPEFSDAESATTRVVGPVPAVTKVNNAVGPVQPSQEIRYTVQVVTGGAADDTFWHDAVVVDRMPVQMIPLEDTGGAPAADGATIEAGAIDGTWDAVANEITFPLGDVAPGTTINLVYHALVTATPIAAEDYTNSVTVTGDTMAGSPAEQRVFVVSDDSLLEIAKPVLATGYDSGRRTIGEPDLVSTEFTIPANTRLLDALVQDTVPDGLTFLGFDSVNCTQNGGACSPFPVAVTSDGGGEDVDGTTDLSWDFGDIAIAAEERVVTLSYDVRVDDTKTGGGTVNRGDLLANDVRMSWKDDFAGVLEVAPVTDSMLVVEPILNFDKDIGGQIGDSDTRRVDVDAVVTHVIAVTNSGEGDASDAYDLRVVDEVPVGLDAPTLITGGGVWDPIGRTITWDVAGPLTPGSSTAFQYAAEVTDSWALPATASTAGLPATAELTQYFGVDQADPASPDPLVRAYSGSVDTTTLRVDFPELVMTASGASTETRTGQSFRWSLGVVNSAAQAFADDVVIVVDLPPNWTYAVGGATIAYPGSVGFVDIEPVDVGGTLTFDLTDVTDLGPTEYIQIRVDAVPTSATSVDPGIAVPNVMQGSVTATDADGNAGNADDVYGTDQTASVIVREVADIVVIKDVDVATVDRTNPQATYTIQVRNDGPNDATSLIVNDLLPAGVLTLITATPSRGIYDAASGDWAIGNVLAGETVTLILDVTADDPVLGDPDPVVNEAHVLALDQFDEGFGPSADTAEIHVQRADLMLAMTATSGPYYRGDPVSWTINVENLGPDAADDVTVETIRPAGVGSQTFTFDGNYDGTTWDLGSMPSGSVRSLVLEGVVEAVGNHRLDAQVMTSDESDPNSTPGNSAFGENDQATITISATGASIGDNIWYDADANGARGAAEPGIEAMTVELRDGGGAFVASQTTDPNGSYRFDGLYGGDYVVSIVDGLPLGTVVSYDKDDGTVDPDGIVAVSLANGDSLLDVDFGLGGSGSVGDRVYFDVDDDGFEGLGEPGIADVDIRLTWFGSDETPGGGDDVTFPIVTTEVDGSWLVRDLPAGMFMVEVTAGTPAGMAFGSDVDGAITAGSATFVLLEGEDRSDVDFGLVGTGRLGDEVWYDVNGDGGYGADEPPIPGVSIKVTWFGQDGVKGGIDDANFPLKVSDADGLWDGGRMPAGNYELVVVAGVPDGMEPSADSEGPPDGIAYVTLDAGASRDDQDFGFTGVGLIGDRIFLDLDADGVEDEEDPGLIGINVPVTFYGFDGVLGTSDDVAVTLTTDSAGHWEYTKAVAGRYLIALDPFSLPGGLVQTLDPDGGTPHQIELVLLAQQTRDDADMGYAGTGSFGDYIWFDRDPDGVVDGDEPGLEGVGVAVRWDGPDSELGTPDDLILPPVFSVVDGAYVYPNLPAGTFDVYVTAAMPGGLTPATDPDGGSDGRAEMELLGGQSRTDADFGLTGRDAIGTVVYLDLDGDGTQGVTDPGIAGAELDLRWAGPDDIFGNADDQTWSTTSGDDGSYSLPGVPDGEYRLVATVTSIEGIVPSEEPDGVLDGVGEFTLVGGTATANFGFRGTGVASDLVWFDLDADGEVDADEPGLSLVELQITWAGPSGSFGGSDDVVWPSVLTGELGQYVYPYLVKGTYSLDVVGGPTLTMIPTYDLDDGTNDPDGKVGSLFVAPGAMRDELDFGFVGPHRLSGSAFLDSDGDGVMEVGEPGLGSMPVFIVWSGSDGSLMTPDDVTIRRTTAADGSWVVAGLPDGQVSVTVDVAGLPDGVVAGSDPDGTTSPNTAVTDLSGDVTGYDFGYRGSGGVTGVVFHDVDEDGAKGPDEPGMQGIRIIATWAGGDGTQGTADDVVVDTTTTADGVWVANGLPPGPIEVTAVQATFPSGFTPGYDLDGSEDASAVVALGPGETREDVDFGLIGNGRLAGVTFLDLNHDGVIDPSESPIGDVRVLVTHAGPDAVFGTGDDASYPTMVTDVDGAWAVERVPGGRLRVSVDAFPTGMIIVSDADGDVLPNADAVAEITLGPAEQDEDINFGLAGNGSIRGEVYLDRDRDGLHDDNPSEPEIAGAPIEVRWWGADRTLDTDDDAVFTTVSEADGSWSLVGLSGGRVRVTLSSPDGFEVVSDPDTTPDGVFTFDLADTEQRTMIDFGLDGTGSLGDRVWFDVDGDEILDDTEDGVADVPINVRWAGPDNLIGTADDLVYDTTRTDDDGFWIMEGVPAGIFEVNVAEYPDGTEPGYDRDGGGDGVARVPVVAGQARDDVDFGIVGRGSISGMTFHDVDADGVRDPEDEPLPGVELWVVWAGPDATPDTADDLAFAEVTTDADGMWVLDELPAGEYAIWQRPPSGWAPTTLAPSGLLVGVGIALSGIELGHRGAGVVTGVVFDDLDGDGVRGDDEGPVPGVGIRVVMPGADDTPGTPDDVLVTSTTDAAGRYAAEFLPPGVGFVEFVTPLENGFSTTIELPLPVDTAVAVDYDIGVLRVADLAVVKTAQHPLGVGSVGSWTIAVANSGPAPASGVVVVDVLEPGLTLGTLDPASGWTCGVRETPEDSIAVLESVDGAAAPVEAVVCEYGTYLAVGATATLDLPVSISPAAFPEVSNTAVVTSDVPDMGMEDNITFATADVRPMAHLVLEQSATPLAAGSDGLITFDIYNDGPNDDRGPITLVDLLPEGLTFEGWSGIGWRCTANGPLVTCVYDDVIFAGDRTVVLIDVAVSRIAEGVLINEGSVLGSAINPIPEDALSVLELPIEVGVGSLARTGLGAGWLFLTSLAFVIGGSGILIILRRGKNEDEDDPEGGVLVGQSVSQRTPGGGTVSSDNDISTDS